MGSVVPPLLTAGAVRLLPDGCTGEGTWRPDNAGKTERATLYFTRTAQERTSTDFFRMRFSAVFRSGASLWRGLSVYSSLSQPFVYFPDNIPKEGDMSRGASPN